MIGQRLCTRCGACCRWPGYVRLAPGEAAAMAGWLGVTESVFVDRYTRLTADRRGLSLNEKADGSCVFLEGRNACRIQPVKPAQCVGFPNAWNFPGFDAQCRSIPADPGGVIPGRACP